MAKINLEVESVKGRVSAPEVLVDGIPYSIKHRRPIQVPLCSTKLFVSHRGYQSVSQILELKQGKTRDIPITLAAATDQWPSNSPPKLRADAKVSKPSPD